MPKTRAAAAKSAAKETPADLDVAFKPSTAFEDRLAASGEGEGSPPAPEAIRADLEQAEREKEPDHPAKPKESDKPAESGADALTGPNQKRVDAVEAAVRTSGEAGFEPVLDLNERTGTDVQNAHDTGSNLDAAARLADERDIGLPEPEAPDGLLPADEVAKRNKKLEKAAVKNVDSGDAVERETAIRDALKDQSDAGIAKGDPVLYTHDDGQEYEATVDEGFRTTFNLRVPGLNPPRMSGVRMAPESASKEERVGTFCLDTQRQKQQSANVQSFYGTPRERAHPFSAEVEEPQPA